MSNSISPVTTGILHILEAINRLAGSGLGLSDPRMIIRFLEGGRVYKKFGKVELSVAMPEREGDGFAAEPCAINWPGIGTVDATRAADFANDLLSASVAANAINKVILALTAEGVAEAIPELKATFAQAL